MWTWFRTLFRTASRLRELEREFADISEEWEITRNALKRREERDRKRSSRELAKAVTIPDDDDPAEGSAENHHNHSSADVTSSTDKAVLWRRAGRHLGTEKIRRAIERKAAGGASE